jgi:LacI family transcriptional regulator
MIMPMDYRFGREIVLGAAKYCMAHGLSILKMGGPSPGAIRDPRQDNVVGVISFACEAQMIKKLRRWNVPVVTTSSRLPTAGVASVQADNESIGRMGAEHLISRGFRRLAFCGIRGHGYSKFRCDGFVSAAAEAGVECSSTDNPSIEALEESPAIPMAKWLRSLNHPVGVMACNDIRSRHIVEGCLEAKLRIPEDVAIVGVDNDEVICQAMDPMLSSVDPNAYGIGYEAAAMLMRIVENKETNMRKLIAPLGVVQRQSTFTVSAVDPMVALALSLVHERSEFPLSVQDIADQIGQGRRTLERRFRARVGYSVAAAIRRAHVERARQLLIDTDLTLEEIAEAAGLKDVRQLRVSFQRVLGVSPLSVRQSFQKLG